MKEIDQSKFFTKIKLELKEDGIQSYLKEFGAEYDKFIPYRKIEPKNKCRTYTETFPKIYQIGLGLCAITALKYLFSNKESGVLIIATTIGFGIGLLCLASYFIIKIKYLVIELEDETQLLIIDNKPNKEEAKNFLNAVFEHRKENYRKNYFYINYDNDKEDEIGKMNWLKSEEIITNNEYQVVLEEIEDKF